MSFRTIALAALLALSVSVARAEIVEIDVRDSTEHILLDLPEEWSHIEKTSKNADQKMIVHFFAPAVAEGEEWKIMLILTVSELPSEGHLSPIIELTEKETAKFRSDFCRPDAPAPNVSPLGINGFVAVGHYAFCFVRANPNTEGQIFEPQKFEGRGGLTILGNRHLYRATMSWRSNDTRHLGFLTPDGAQGEIAELTGVARDILFKGILPCDTADMAKPCEFPSDAAQ